MANGTISTKVIAEAHALVITNKFKVGFILGVEDGWGVIMVKKANGSWSVPVLVTAGEASLGFQIGANASESVLVVTDDTTPKKIFERRFNVGVDAKAVAGPSNADAEKVNRKLLETPVIVYSTARGLYAGATVKSGWLERDDNANFILYSTNYTMPELLYSDWVKPVPEVQPLMDYVKQIAP
jgi:lipid-binding SYLF domain-containing protein